MHPGALYWWFMTKTPKPAPDADEQKPPCFTPYEKQSDVLKRKLAALTARSRAALLELN